MSGLILCFVAFGSCLAVSRASISFGLIVFLLWGYFYGFLKANYIDSFGLFIFDAATLGFYVGLFVNPSVQKSKHRIKTIFPWIAVMIGWPVFMTLIPIQHILVQVIGLRGNIFWLPMVLVGFLLKEKDKSIWIIGLCLLNFISFGFAIAEFFIGVEYFIPQNSVTKIVFESNDLKDGSLRIPSIFANAHSYAGVMMATIPWIVGEILVGHNNQVSTLVKKSILVVGLFCAGLGIFIAGPRQPVVILGLFTVLALFSNRFNLGFILIAVIASGLVGYFVMQEERMQRFTSLQDFDSVQSRIGSSVNYSLINVILDYPMGNGMGSGGTSLPFFAQQLLSDNIVLENEFARILLEQGIPGLAIFFGFFAWYMTRKIEKKDPDFIQKKQIGIYSFVAISTAFIGIGLMSSVPGTALLLLGVGYSISPIFDDLSKSVVQRPNSDRSLYREVPAYQRGLQRA